MNDKDDFYGMAEESSRLLARQADSRGLGADVTPKLTRVGPPRAPAASIAPGPPFDATAAGKKVRAGITRNVNAVVGGVEQGINTATSPLRASAGIARDFTRAVTGARPAPDAGTTPAGVTLPRLIGGPAEAPRAPTPRGGQPYAYTMRRSGPAGVPAPAATPPVVMNATNPAMARGRSTVPAGVTRTVSADGVPTFTGAPGATAATNLGTYSGDQGIQPRITRSAAAAQAAAPFDPQAIARASVADLRGLATTVRRDAAAGLNPMSEDAEILRRLENSQASYFNKGRPSARAAQAQAYLSQLGARRGASEAFQEGAGQAIQAGARGAVQLGLDAQQIEGAAGLHRQGLEGAMELASAAENRPKIVRNAEDGILRVRRGTTATAVTDESGQPIRQASVPAPGALTPQDLLESYSAEREAITGSLASPAEKAAAMAALDNNPLYGPILGRGAAIPDLGAFLVSARAANPEASEQELVDYYRNEYGDH